MRNDLKIKFLQHFNQKKGDEGFTLIELLVVIIIIGILSAIALPSFLSQANKAKLTEAKTTLSGATTEQKVLYNDGGTFAAEENFEALQDEKLVNTGAADWLESLGIAVNGTVTKNYEYRAVAATAVTNDFVIGGVTMQARPVGGINAAHKAYVVGMAPIRGIVDDITCEALEPPNVNNALVGDNETQNDGTAVTCPDADNWRPSK